MSKNTIDPTLLAFMESQNSNVNLNTQEKQLPAVESNSKVLEGELILAKLAATDQLILLDENGKSFTSIDFANELQKKMNSGVKTLVFVIGGPYGFSDTVYAKAQGKISLSLMTFSHQMVRLFFIEQLYRGLTILKNEPYHHQ